MPVKDIIPPKTERGSAIGDGSTVLSWQQFGGGDGLEKVVELQWPNSVAAYRSMMNDAQVQALMFGLILPIRAYRWYLDENGSKPEIVDRIATDYNLPVGIDQTQDFQRRRGQRRFSFEKHMEDAFRALIYGHYFFEQVGEIRPDLKWHLTKLGLRPPRTITEINVAKDGGLADIVQGYKYPNPIRIPVDHLVAYVWDREGANWVGRPMLRPIYRNFVVKDRVLRVGAINIERAGGVPFIEAPDGASGDQIRELDALARRFRVGEGAGAALPHGAQLKFASASGGDGAVAYIKQQNEEMARSFCQMVIMLGQTNSGSRALGDVFHEILKIAQYTIAKWFADLFNEHVIEDDVEFNEGPTEEFAPLLKFDAGQQDPMMGFDQALANAADPNSPTGLQVNDPSTRKILGKPPVNDKKVAAHRRRHRVAGTPIAAASSSLADGVVSSGGMPREVTYEVIPESDGLLSNVRNVEICCAGLEYPLSTGPRTFTPEDLISARDSQEDPALKKPRTWLGHADDDRFRAGVAAPVASAEPALGVVDNMRIEDEGLTLVGDLANCPTWLAKIMASAYPNRSVDGYVDATSVSGSTWPLVITDLALLGVQWPGVTNLKDIQTLYSESGPEGVIVEEMEPIAAIAASIKVSAQAELDAIQRAFRTAVDVGDIPIPGWPWIRVILQDPNELIVDDDQGGLWAVAFDASGDDVTFSVPIQKKIQYVNASQARDPHARTLLTNMLTNGRKVAASWETRAASRPANEQEGSTVDPVIIESLRKAHGLTAEQLPDGATEDQIKAAIQPAPPPNSPSAPAVTPTTPPATPPGPARPGDDPGGGPPSPDQVPQGPGPGKLETDKIPVAASGLPPGMVAVPQEQWIAVQAGAQMAVKQGEENEKATDVRILGDAIRAGKVATAWKDSYANGLNNPATRAQYRHLLTANVKDGGLAPNTVPVAAMGIDPSETDQQTGPAYPAEWLPELRDREMTLANPVTIEA